MNKTGAFLSLFIGSFFYNYAIVFILCTVKIIKLSLVSYLHFFNAGENLEWIEFWARRNIYRLHFPSGCCDRYLFECLRSLLGALNLFMRFLCSRRPKECANFIIGANGSGKSSILEAIVLGRFLARILIFACYAEHLYRAHISLFLSLRTVLPSKIIIVRNCASFWPVWLCLYLHLLIALLNTHTHLNRLFKLIYLNIYLGLCGVAKNVGRYTKLEGFVKKDCPKAVIEVI